MNPDPRATARRPHRRALLRALATTPGAVLLVAPARALAAPPEQWADAPGVSPLEFLLVLVLVPAGLFAVITLLAVLPSIVSGDRGYQPGGVWRNEPEWFGGPREGLGRVDREKTPALGAGGESGERGGASGSW